MGDRGESGVLELGLGSSERANVLSPPAAKRVELINFSGPKQCFGSNASSVRRSEAPKAMSESHHSLPQGNPAAIYMYIYIYIYLILSIVPKTICIYIYIYIQMYAYMYLCVYIYI